MQQRTIGILQVLLSGFCFGFLGLFGKKAYALGLSPGEFLALRFLIASALLGLYLLARSPKLFLLAPGTIARCAFLGILGYAVFSSCFFFALRGLSVSLTVLLLYTYPAIVSLGAWRFFGEKLKIQEVLALPLSIFGLALLVWGDMQVRSPWALLLGFAAAVFYSAYILASSRWLKAEPPLGTTFYVMLSAGIALGAWHLQPAHFPLPREAWAMVGGAGLISSVLAMSLFLAGLQKLKSGEVSLLSTAEPITAVALAGLLWGERLSLWQWGGGALVILGMLLVARAQGGLEKGLGPRDA